MATMYPKHWPKPPGSRAEHTEKSNTGRKPWEFSKKLAVWCVVIATGTVAASYVLAFRGLETAEGITNTIFTACVGYLVTYAAKSATEKISRNRHGLDADGNPIETIIERED